MFNKILIAEDHEIANISVQKTLQDLGVSESRYVYYCDHALTWVKNAIRYGAPFELLITDLIFEDDNTSQHINDGIILINEVKKLQEDLKIIILSAERKSLLVDEMLRQGLVDAYVRKARRDGQYLREALYAAWSGKTYVSPEISNKLTVSNSHEFSKQDIAIVSLLSQGILQKNIPSYLEQQKIKPSGLSSIEKSLKQMKFALGFSNNEQLIAYCKDMGIL